MEDKITNEMFEEFTRVAEVELTPEESKKILAEMRAQLTVIGNLAAIPIDDDLRPVIHGNPYPFEIRPALREDVWVPFENPQAILDQVPRTEDGYIISPDVAHQKIG